MLSFISQTSSMKKVSIDSMKQEECMFRRNFTIAYITLIRIFNNFPFWNTLVLMKSHKKMSRIFRTAMWKAYAFAYLFQHSSSWSVTSLEIKCIKRRKQTHNHYWHKIKLFVSDNTILRQMKSSTHNHLFLDLLLKASAEFL